MENRTAQDWIELLMLEPHIEGGYFREIYEAAETITTHSGEERNLYSSIYFLLEDTNPSNFHRLTVDEIWYYHAGAPITIHMIHPNGSYESVQLGIDLSEGLRLQYRVPAGVIFGSSVEQENSFSVVSCMCGPGFEYEDFELFSTKDLLNQYPAHEKIIKKLTRE